MEWVPYIKERIPGVIRGITQMLAANVGQPAAMVDPTPQFMEKRLAILSKYQAELKEQAQTPISAPAPAEIINPRGHLPPLSPAAVAECPYCNLEELAGIVRNHMLFVAQECKEGDLGPATGGMIPKAKASTEDFIRKVGSLDAPNHIQLVAQLAMMKAQELLPRLEWINNCEEAQEAATIADEMWHRAAKATQMYYATTPDSPYS
jgi:hypothetical protein